MALSIQQQNVQIGHAINAFWDKFSSSDTWTSEELEQGLDPILLLNTAVTGQIFWRFEIGLRAGRLLGQRAADAIESAGLAKSDDAAALDDALKPLEEKAALGALPEPWAMGAGFAIAIKSLPAAPQRSAKIMFLRAMREAGDVSYSEALGGVSFGEHQANHKAVEVEEALGGAAVLGASLRLLWTDIMHSDGMPPLAIADWSASPGGRSFMAMGNFNETLANLTRIGQEALNPHLVSNLGAAGDSIRLEIAPWMGASGSNDRIWAPGTWTAAAFEALEGKTPESDPTPEMLLLVQKTLALAMLLSPYGKDWSEQMRVQEPAAFARVQQWAGEHFGANLAVQTPDGKNVLTRASAELESETLRKIAFSGEQGATGAQPITATTDGLPTARRRL